MPINVTLHGRVHGNNAKPSDYFGRITNLTWTNNYVTIEIIHVGINILKRLVSHRQRRTTGIDNLAAFHVFDDRILHHFGINRKVWNGRMMA